MPFGRFWLGLIALFVSVCATNTVHAWTDASVHTVRAHIDLQPDGAIVVAYELTVVVHAGWVEGLEIAGLDPRFQLLESMPPSWVSADGETKYTPQAVRRRRDRLYLNFRRSTSPRRGHYSVRFAYRAQLGADAIRTTDEGRIQVDWSLPGWSSGLDGVWISLSAPAGAAEFIPEAGGAGPAADVWSNETRTLLRWHRAHLPRTTEWPLHIDLPPDSMAAGLFRPLRAKREAPEIEAPPPAAHNPWPHYALGLFGLILIGRRTLFVRACRRRDCQPRGLIPLPRPWVRVFLIAIATAAALSLERSPSAPHAPQLGTWRPASRVEIRRARRALLVERLLGAGPLDLTSLQGWFWLSGLGALAVYFAEVLAIHLPSGGTLPAWPLIGLLAAVGLTATRLHLPTSVALRLNRLRRIALQMRRPLNVEVRAGLRLMLHESSDGGHQDARLRVFCDEAPTGLLRCDIAIAQRRDLGGYADEPQLILVTRKASRAEAAIAKELSRSATLEAPGGRVARVLPHLDGKLGPILELLHAIRPRTSRVTILPGETHTASPKPPPLPYRAELR